MKLVSVQSVALTADPTAMDAIVIIRDDFGDETIRSYALRFDDPYGLAPAIREAIGWTDRENPPGMGA